jgi:hypothetical protein
MSTWQQHAASNTATNNTNQSEISHHINNRTKSIEISDGLGEINHTSALSADFGT